MANVTFKIDDQLLDKARRLANQRKTSLNAIVRERIEAFVSSDRRRELALQGLEDFFERSQAIVGPKTWTREDLHER